MLPGNGAVVVVVVWLTFVFISRLTEYIERLHVRTDELMRTFHW